MPAMSIKRSAQHVPPSPDGAPMLGIAYGPNAAESNDARFDLPAFNALFERQQSLPDGPERLATLVGAEQGPLPRA